MKVHPARTKKLSPIFTIIVYGFKVIGLAPFSLQRTETPVVNSRNRCCTSAFLFSKKGLTYNILLSVTAQVMGVLAIPQLYSMSYPNKTSITESIDVGQGILRTSATCIIIFTWTVRQRNAASIMNRLLEVDYLLSATERRSSNQWKSFISFTLQISFNILLWVIFWASEEEYVSSILSWYIWHIPIFIIHWFGMQYFIVLEVLARKLKSLNKNLLKFKEFPNYLFRTPLPNNHRLPAVLNRPAHDSQLAALELLHSIRTTLSDVSQEVADFFSFPILPTVACYFVGIIYNLYYLVTPFVLSIHFLPISIAINVTTWISVCIYPLVLLSFNVGKTFKEAKLTGIIVHKLLAAARRQEIQTELERFSLQLMHEDLTFTAYGFFTLDFTLIQAILGVTATYLIIIIQFMQSSANASNNSQCETK